MKHNKGQSESEARKAEHAEIDLRSAHFRSHLVPGRHRWKLVATCCVARLRRSRSYYVVHLSNLDKHFADPGIGFQSDGRFMNLSKR